VPIPRDELRRDSGPLSGIPNVLALLGERWQLQAACKDEPNPDTFFNECFAVAAAHATDAGLAVAVVATVGLRGDALFAAHASAPHSILRTTTSETDAFRSGSMEASSYQQVVLRRPGDPRRVFCTMCEHSEYVLGDYEVRR
jgi:molybdopterin-guanine dinucleotide biosynthesis protein A